MWKTKFFKTYESANKFISINQNKFQTQLLFIENGFAVEYKELKTIY